MTCPKQRIKKKQKKVFAKASHVNAPMVNKNIKNSNNQNITKPTQIQNNITTAIQRKME
jgi:hypothetical protein